MAKAKSKTKVKAKAGAGKGKMTVKKITQTLKEFIPIDLNAKNWVWKRLTDPIDVSELPRIKSRMPGFNGKNLDNYIVLQVKIPTVDKKPMHIMINDGSIRRAHFIGHLFYSIDMDYRFFTLNMFDEIQKNSRSQYAMLKRGFNQKLTEIRKQIRSDNKKQREQVLKDKRKEREAKKKVKGQTASTKGGTDEGTKTLAKGAATKKSGTKRQSKKIPLK